MSEEIKASELRYCVLMLESLILDKRNLIAQAESNAEKYGGIDYDLQKEISNINSDIKDASNNYQNILKL